MTDYNESTPIRGQYDSNVYVALFDKDSVWLNIQHNHGGANCTLSLEAAKTLINTLQQIVGAAE